MKKIKGGGARRAKRGQQTDNPVSTCREKARLLPKDGGRELWWFEKKNSPNIFWGLALLGDMTLLE